MFDQIDKYVEEVRQNNNLPTIEGLALHMGIDDDTIVEWCKIHKDFSAAIKGKITIWQKERLMNDGLYSKDTNATMAIFLLKVNHGMIETERKELTGKDGDKLEIVFVEDKHDSHTEE